MSKMPFHLQPAPPQRISHRPSADCRLPSISVPPPPPGAPYPHTITNCRVRPPPPLHYLPPISYHNPPPLNYPPTKYSHRYLIPSSPSTAAPQIGPPAHDAAGSGPGPGSTGGAPSPAQAWAEMQLKDLEVFARNDSGEEKGKAFLGLWLGIREAGLRDKQSVRLFIAKKLMPYDWFKGDETVGEALRTLHRLEFINAGLVAKKHTENAMWLWNKKIGDVSVREYWTEEGRKQREKARLQENVQAQSQR